MTEPIEQCPFVCENNLSLMPLNDKLCRCSLRCSIACEHSMCENGFEKDEKGCDICDKCKKSINKCEQDSNKDCHKCLCKDDGDQFCTLNKCQNYSYSLSKKNNYNLKRSNSNIWCHFISKMFVIKLKRITKYGW
jgi:hypothetical protein